MTTVTDKPAVTTYGGWRRRRGFEVLGFSSGQLGVLLTAVVVPLIVMLFAIRAGLVLGVPALVVIALVSWRTDGRPRVLLLAERQRWLRASSQGLTVTQSEVVQPLGRPAYLPGPMAALELLKVATPSGQPAGWVWDRQPGTLTAQLRTTSVGTLLADGADADNWVAQYGGWQASLGYVPGIRSITVVHETAPSSGHRVRDHVEARLDPAAPALARELMNMELANSPGRSAEIKQWVSVTIDTHKLQTRPTTLIDAVADASLTLGGVSESLSSGGVHVLGRATPTWITSRIRAAFDPASRGEIERELVDEAPLEWSEAGPFAAREMWDHLQHDSGFSVTLALRELPRSPVRHDVLRRLMAPGRWPRRVAMLYTPYPAEVAEEIVDSEMTAAAVRESAARRTKRDFTIKEQMDARRAASAAIEQQQGAGLGELSLFVTVTTTSREDLALAVADVETRARGCRLRLVRMYGAQMIGFATTLGIGVDPFELAARTPGRRK